MQIGRRLFLVCALALVSTPQLEAQDRSRPWPASSQIFGGPFGLAGPTLPTGPDAKAGFSGNAGIILGFHLQGFLYRYAGLFASVEGDMRSARIGDHDLSNFYISVMPGISYRGLVNLGIAIGLPITSTLIDYAGEDSAPLRTIDTKNVNLLIEPRLLLGYPLIYNPRSGSMLLVLVQAGYPIKTVFNKQLLRLPDGYWNTGELRLPAVRLGLTYVFKLWESESGIYVD